jgi:hypothetical protein
VLEPTSIMQVCWSIGSIVIAAGSRAVISAAGACTVTGAR